MNNKTLIVIVSLIAFAGITFAYVNQEKQKDLAFEKKQECSQYSDLVDQRIKESGRVFENDSFTVQEIFYSPKMNSCLYAYTIYTTLDPKELYSIDDLFGGSIYSGGIAPDAKETFYKEISDLKK